MPASLQYAVLDRDQFRSVTLDDEELMRDVLAALIDDTARQFDPLRNSIAAGDGEKTRRLAHYSKGACANVGAAAAAAILRRMESEAAAADFTACAVSLAALREELERLRTEAAVLYSLPVSKLVP